MDKMEIIYKLAQMSGEVQNRFFKALAENGLTEKEIEPIMIMVGVVSMELNPEKKKAIKAALAEHLYKEFNK